MDRLKNTLGLKLQNEQVLPQNGEAVCEPISEHASMVFLANGLSTQALKAAFNTLASSQAEKKRKKVSDLKALVLWDSCFMFESVWSKDWKCTEGKAAKNWTSSDVYHFDKFHNPLTADFKPFTKPEMMAAPGTPDGIQATNWAQDGDCVKQSKSPNFQPYWCEDFGEVFSESGIGAIHHLSLIDTLANDDLKRALPSLNMPTWDYHRLTFKFLNSSNVWDIKPRNDYDTKNLMAILDDYDIIAFDGGNPDMHRLGLSLAGAEFRQTLNHKVKEGSLLYIGRSAGAIIASQDSITFEPNPAMWYYFSTSTDSNIKDFWPREGEDSLEGLNLIDCGIRPHFNEGWEPGVQGYVAYTYRKVVRLRNNAGFFCTEGECVGLASALAKQPFVNWDSSFSLTRWKQANRLLEQHNLDQTARSLQYGTAIHALKNRLIWLRFKGHSCQLEILKNMTTRRNVREGRQKCEMFEVVETHESDASHFAEDDKVFDHTRAEDNPESLKHEDLITHMMRQQLERFDS